MSDQELKMLRAALVLGFLGMVAMPVWAEEEQGVVREQARTVRIQELQRERAKVEGELGSSACSRKVRLVPQFHGASSRINRRKA